jgi:hypothetical protein
MRRIPVVVVFLVILGGIFSQVRGNSSEVATYSIPAGHLTNHSAVETTQLLSGTQARLGSPSDSPLLVSQAYGTKPRKRHLVLLTWVPSLASAMGENVIGYNVYRRSALGTTYLRMNDDLVSVNSYVDDSVRAGATYNYRTTAVNSAGIESAPSNQISVTIPYP